jgi:cobalt/nickel transport system permease protein
VIGAGMALLAAALASAPAPRSERWAGLDETVVERVSAEAGNPRWRTWLDDSGDLPLFLFLSAGIAGGFALGYGYRAVFSPRQHEGRER